MANKKFGYLHIQKTAGSSLNTSIFHALRSRKTHISNVIKKDAARKDASFYELEKGTLSYAFARNNPYVTGHISFRELEGLDRDFIFTVLRDPRVRLISFFTYVKSRAKNQELQQKNPKLSTYQNMGLYEFLENIKPVNGISKALFRDINEFFKNINTNDRKSPSLKLLNNIESGLKRFDVIYCTSQQNILNDLASRGLFETAQEIRVNESSEEIVFGNLGGRQNLLKAIDDHTWLDMIVFRAAKQLFPDYVTEMLASDDALVDYLKRRFCINL